MESVREALLQFGETVEPEELTPALVTEASHLIASDPFAFAMAVALDRGTKAEIIWTIPYWIRQHLSHLDPARISQMNEGQVRDILIALPRKPRYLRDAPQTILDLARMVTNEFGGNTELIWRDRTARDVQSLFRRIHGVGPGIASMAIILLQRCKRIRFPDLSTVNVKPDVHVCRVLFRLGVASSMREDDAVDAAARLNPDFPGALDPALWIIGRQWCRELTPNCPNCPIGNICPKIGVAQKK